jgi:hypothetical protein
MDESFDPRAQMLHSVAGSVAVSAAYPEHDDREGHRGYTQFSKDLSKAMTKRGWNSRGRKELIWIRDVH